MAKVRKVFICSSCGTNSAKWIGKCPSCESWNTYVEEIIERPSNDVSVKPKYKEEHLRIPKTLANIKAGDTARYATGDKELDRVLGGGIVSGSMILLGGQPGIGKSTLMLQTVLRIDTAILYTSGEESEEQIKMRAERIGILNENCYIYAETNVQKIIQQAQKLQPHLLVIDSIQTLSSSYIDAAPGSVSQVRESAAEIQRFAKETNTPVFIIGHITKDGAIAGPKLLEHIVDVVLLFEGDQNYSYRILRTNKNRFGSTDEIGIYEMQAEGLREVNNPSELLISQTDERLSGSSIASSVEGQRPLLIETQALVSPAIYGTPQRSSTGFDLRRLSMILAVLEKRCGLQFGTQDVFLNIAGGLKVVDPAIDLAIVAALISSLQDIAISKNICFAGEVGLSGEIRAISRIDQRIQEAERLGMETIYISRYNKGVEQKDYHIEIQAIGTVVDLLTALFDY
jgi:DNA repair protein RadA/Sms